MAYRAFWFFCSFLILSTNTSASNNKMRGNCWRLYTDVYPLDLVRKITKTSELTVESIDPYEIQIQSQTFKVTKPNGKLITHLHHEKVIGAGLLGYETQNLPSDSFWSLAADGELLISSFDGAYSRAYLDVPVSRSKITVATYIPQRNLIVVGLEDGILYAFQIGTQKYFGPLFSNKQKVTKISYLVKDQHLLAAYGDGSELSFPLLEPISNEDLTRINDFIETHYPIKNAGESLSLYGILSRATLSYPGKESFLSLLKLIDSQELILPRLRNRREIENNAFEINSVGDWHGDPLLYVAAQWGHLEAMEILLSFGAFIDVRSQTGDTPLMAAIKNHDIQMTKFLLDRGADIRKKNDLGQTPTSLARQRAGDDPAVQKILEMLEAHGPR